MTGEKKKLLEYLNYPQDKDYELGEDELLELKFDRLFHDMFNEHEMDTIEWLVSKILDCSIKDIHGNVRVGNIRLTNKSRDDKQKFVDLVVYYKNMINVIELNNEFTGNYLRNTLYILNVINNSYIEGGRYTERDQNGNELRKIRGILVNLNWPNNKKAKPKEEYYYPYPIVGEEKDDYLLKIVNINLDYYKKESYNGKCDKDVLYKLITRTSKKELKKIVDNEKELTNYYDKMDYLSHSKEYCHMVWDERIDENLKNQEVFYGGFQEGIQEKQKEMVINMYKDNLPIEKIAAYASISDDNVRDIIKNSQH